ncbi:MAG: SDR family NAD(P)-dependent oxidoreductase, partial [Actinomycetes bacterium]
MSANLRGRRVLVLGAAGGLGPSACHAAGVAGASVHLAGRNGDALERVAAQIAGAAAGKHTVDLLDAQATSSLASSLEGGVDAVWHLVGGWRGGTPVQEQSDDDWNLLHDSLVRTTVNVVRAFTPALKASDAGRFVIISSPQAVSPSSTNAAYASAKAASEAITLALADELSGSRATANIVVVPAILTPAMRVADPNRSRPSFVTAETVAEALVYLTSDAASAMNGQRL